MQLLKCELVGRTQSVGIMQKEDLDNGRERRSYILGVPTVCGLIFDLIKHDRTSKSFHTIENGTYHNIIFLGVH